MQDEPESGVTNNVDKVPLCRVRSLRSAEEEGTGTEMWGEIERVPESEDPEAEGGNET